MASVPPIIKSIRIKAGPERAFKTFTTNIIRWWPPDYTIGASPMRDIVLEPFEGGKWYEVGEDGSQCQWGDVLAWDPPGRLVLAWRIRLDWTFDPSLLTEIEVTFSRLDTGGTEVLIQHGKFENLGEMAPKALEIFDGWSSVLARYAEVLESD